MGLPPVASSGDAELQGETYGAVGVAEADLDFSDAVDVLRGIGFSGWAAPARAGWIVVLGDPGDGVVADKRRGIVEVGAELAQRSAGTVIAVRVRRDRQLAVVAWHAGDEVGRYCSDPSREPGADDDVLDQPVGAEIADSLAELFDRADAAEELTELLDEELDPESVFESERLDTLLRALGLPTWIVAAGALPHDIPTGPRANELTRLRAGASGLSARARDSVVRAARRRQSPPWVIAEPPRMSGGGFDEWMF
jgi:hypothetical protein